MQKTQQQRLLSLLLCIVLIAAMALTATGCSDKKVVQNGTVTFQDGAVMGKGEKVFTLTVIDKEGTEISCEVHTDKKTVGEALLELQLIAGEDGAYGLYIKSVCGITADYNTDGTYWAFYIDGAYATSGVDTTDIAEGSVYTLKVE